MKAQYKIVTGVSLDQLVDQVNRSLKEGWKVVGGICRGETSFNWQYIQAMTKTFKRKNF